MVSLYQSTGQATLATGKQVPLFNATTALAQVQAMSTKDLQHANNLNLTGIMRKVYLEGPQWSSVVRADLRGGDIFVFDDHSWLLTTVMESWPDWSAVIVTQQDKPFVPPIVPDFTVLTPVNFRTHLPPLNYYSLEIDDHDVSGPISLSQNFVSGPGDDLVFTFQPLNIDGFQVYFLNLVIDAPNGFTPAQDYVYDLVVTATDLIYGPLHQTCQFTYFNFGDSLT
jgi:hypothetical protein